MNIKRINDLISDLTQEIANNYDYLENAGYKQEIAKLMLTLIESKKAFSRIDSEPETKIETETSETAKVVDGKKLAELSHESDKQIKYQAEYFGK
jgi:ketol-acid reductoisomerase